MLLAGHQRLGHPGDHRLQAGGSRAPEADVVRPTADKEHPHGTVTHVRCKRLQVTLP